MHRKGEWFYIKDLHEKNRGIGLYKIGNANIVTFVAQSRCVAEIIATRKELGLCKK